MWFLQLRRRRRDVWRYRRGRIVPALERYTLAGDLSFWFCLILAVSTLILALARPQALVSQIQNAGVDFVVLQDGSTSMRVTDVTPDR